MQLLPATVAILNLLDQHLQLVVVAEEVGEAAQQTPEDQVVVVERIIILVQEVLRVQELQAKVMLEAITEILLQGLFQMAAAAVQEQ
jgi:hypothetical protein